MNEWIELNLPFNVTMDYSKIKYPKIPTLNKRAKKELGMSLDESEKTLLSEGEECVYDNRICQEFDKIDHDIREKLYKKNLSNDDFKIERIKRLKKIKNRSVDLVLKSLEFKDSYYEWLEKQPEYIEYFRKHEQITSELKEKLRVMSFRGLGLSKPGVLIEVEQNGKLNQYLIGDVNIYSGVCDDCREFDDDIIIKRYKIIWEKE